MLATTNTTIMFRTIKFKCESEGRFRTVLTKPKNVHQLRGLSGVVAVLTSVIITVIVIPTTCKGYSITSSLGPSSSYVFDGRGPISRDSSSGPHSLVGAPSSTVFPDLTQESVLSSSTRVDSDIEPSGSSSHSSVLMRTTEADLNGRTLVSHNEPNNNGRELKISQEPSHDRANEPHQQQQQPQYTRTQLQVAGRILFESRATTPKPSLGYRAFLSSYRNPNYFVKKTKYSETSYVPSRAKHIYATASHGHEEDEEEHDEESESSYGAAFSNSSKLIITSKSVKRAQSAVVFPTLDPSTKGYDVTTPESKTAPATSVYAVSERPTSTQQMQSDSPYFPLSFSQSDSHQPHHQPHNRHKQHWAYDDKPAVQIDPPSVYQNKTGKTVLGTSQAEPEESEPVTDHVSKGSDLVRDVKEDPIVFPTTPSHRTYKIPSHDLDEADLAALKSILGLRKGSDGVKSTESTSTTASGEKFSPLPQGAKEPDCAKNLGYCDIENFQDNYPKELLNNVLTNSISSDVFKKVFGDDTEAAGASALAGSPDNVVLAGRNNINIPAEESALCGSQEVTIYPRVARNKDDKWMFIVNHDDYVQGVKVEKCMNEGSPCLFSEGNPLGYESVCRQKFILRKLVALNGEGKTALDTFKLPSCCVCYIKSSHVSNRIGISTSNASRPPVLSDKGSSSGPSEGGSGAESSPEVVGPTGCTPFNIEPPKPSNNATSTSTSTPPRETHKNGANSSLPLVPSAE